MNVYVSEVREWERRKKPCNAICCWLCIASNRNDIERVSEREIKCVYGESRIFLTISLFLTLTYIWDGMSLGPPSFSHSLAEHDCAVQRQKKITLYSRNSSIIAAFDQTHQVCLHAFMWYVLSDSTSKTGQLTSVTSIYFVSFRYRL